MGTQWRGQLLVINAIQTGHGFPRIALVQIQARTKQGIALPVALLQLVRVDRPEQGSGRTVIACPQFSIGCQQAVIIRVVGIFGEALIDLRGTSIIAVTETFARLGYHRRVAMACRLPGTAGQQEDEA